MKYKDPKTGEYKDIFLKTGDTLPVGTIVEYDGDEVPAGYEEVLDASESNLDIYLTEETRIGTWLGKPLYRKIVNHSNALSAGNNAIAHKISNIDVVTKVDGYTILGTNNYRTGAFESSTKFINIKTVDSTYINVHVGSDWGSSFKNGFVTILEYTKTTD